MVKKAKTSIAKGLIKGAMQSLSHQWTIEWFRDAAARDADFGELIHLAPPWDGQLYQALDDYPELRQTQLIEVIGWIKQKEGNPALVDELGPDPVVMGWLTRAWKRFLNGDKGSG